MALRFLTFTCVHDQRLAPEVPVNALCFLTTPIRFVLVLWLVLSVVIPAAAQTPTATDLYTFVAPDGLNPYASLVQASDGNFYGTTVSGGPNGGNTNGGFGTVFKITPSGTLTTLHAFSFTGSDGSGPQAGLIQASDGNLYGMTEYGGVGRYGTVFRITTSGTLTTLYSFNGSDGAYPIAGLIQGSDGNLYGTTGGGHYEGGNGTVFKITLSGTLTVLHAFSALIQNVNADGADPYGGLVQGTDGNFYGTTYQGGANAGGTVFKITPDGTLTTLYAFSGNDGAKPYASLTQASDGALYGTTYSGGANFTGTIFKITTSGTLTTLYSFSATTGNYVNADGANPKAGLLKASDGNLYGTTYYGGTNGTGTVFKVTTSGTLTSLYSFSALTWNGNQFVNADGANPEVNLIQARNGNLYGTMYQGGPGANGTVFKITTSGTLTTLYSFIFKNGYEPLAGLIQGSDGNLYGTTGLGGANADGTVFKITPEGTLTTLHAFNFSDGAYPLTSLMQASDGNLYGTTDYGNTNFTGTIFKITPSGALTTLYAFSAVTKNGNHFVNADGADPQAGLIQASDGNFYGTTYQGGTGGYGTVFRITPSGTLTSLYSFSYSDGDGPTGLIQGSDGNLYGTTVGGGVTGYGTVFKITTSGTLTSLYHFSGTDGSDPQAGLVQANDGNFYGTTSSGGGIYNHGTVFRITPSGTLTTLHAFTGSSDGGYPGTALMQASDGNLYGTTYGGVFTITLSGALTSIFSFNNSDGAGGVATLIQASDGNFYGVTSQGGLGSLGFGSGVVFRLNGVYAAPTLNNISPTSLNAGGSAFTLTVKGSQFQPFSTVNWNGSPLATTYVSVTELQATVPASLIASPGKAAITVITGAGGGTSSKKTFTILLTTLKLTAASLTKNNDGSYTANITLKNVGYNTAPNVTITKATLGAAATSTTLPVTIGSIAAGLTGNSSLTFPASSGTSGMVVTMKVSGTFTGGTFSGSFKVMLP